MNLKFQQKNGMLQTVKQQKVKTTKTILLNSFILVTGDIRVAVNDNTDVAFKNCASFSTSKTEINDAFVDEGNHIHIAMPMYNLIEYIDNYSGTSRSLWQFYRDEVPLKMVI